MSLPDPTSSIILFVLTFCVGYITLLISYYRAERLPEWLSLDVFDKTIITFIVGGIITIISFFGLNAPVYSLFYATDATSTSAVFNQLSVWLSRNFGVTVLIESVLIVVIILIIELFLERHSEIRIDYCV